MQTLWQENKKFKNETWHLWAIRRKFYFYLFVAKGASVKLFPQSGFKKSQIWETYLNEVFITISGI